jgi:hypothetical protein
MIYLLEDLCFEADQGDRPAAALGNPAGIR